MPSRDQLIAALDAVADPVTGRGLNAAGRISGLVIQPDGRVGFALEAPAGAGPRFVPVRDAAEAAVASVAGVTSVRAVLTAEAQLGPGTRLSKGTPPAPAPASPGPAATAGRTAQGVKGVRSLLAVSSAKGGVGKSTVAVNLACALARLGLKVGLLDADVYGPSVPTLLGLADAKPTTGADGRLIPLEAFGLKAMSIGFLVDIDAPMIWRGPMATSAIRQMIDDVAWGTEADPLDVLVLDLPPGTGDVQLTIAQRLPLSGAVIVSTPQEIALSDVRRGIAMFDKTHIPILGVIENMAWFEPSPGVRVAVFGEGGARRTASAHGVPFLGELPIEVDLRESADQGRPLVAASPDHPLSRRMMDIAEFTLSNMRAAQKPPPVIRFRD